MPNQNIEFKKIKELLEEHHKDLTTKYSVLVKRTNSIITTLSGINDKLDYLVDTMSMFELIEEENREDFDPYHTEQEDYEQVDDEEDYEDDSGYE